MINKKLKNNITKLLLLSFMCVTLSCSAETDSNNIYEDGYYIALQPEVVEYSIIEERGSDKVFRDTTIKTVLRKMDGVPLQLEEIAAGDFYRIYSGNASSTATVQEQPPVVVEADDLFYDDESGDIVAYGNVIIVNNGNIIRTSEIQGNSKIGSIKTKENERVFFTSPGTSVVTSDVVYNYNDGTGVLSETTGKVDKYYIQGKKIEIFPDKYIIYDGVATRCPGENPDYKITAEKIEIYPNDKMVAYDVDFWIKNRIIYSKSQHKSSLNEKEDDFSFPRVGQSHRLGFYIKQKLEYPITERTTAEADVNYYSKHGFKPGFEIRHRERFFDVLVSTGYYIDWDDRWIKKSPELSIHFHQRKIGRSPLNYSISASYGNWKDDYRSSWHGEYSLYINHDPIKISNSTRLYLGAGIGWISESYDQSHQSTPRFDVTLSKSFSEKLNTFVSYNYRDYGDKSLFEFDIPDAEQQLTYGFSYKLNSKDTIGIAFRYDLENNSHDDLNYFYSREMHCWETVFIYKAKEKDFEWHLAAKRW